jgi:hypothetical protein
MVCLFLFGLKSIFIVQGCVCREGRDQWCAFSTLYFGRSGGRERRVVGKNAYSSRSTRTGSRCREAVAVCHQTTLGVTCGLVGECLVIM